MKRKLFTLENLIGMSVLIPFALFMLAQFFQTEYAYYDYALFGALLVVIIFSVHLGVIPGLLLSGLLVFAYGSVIFYQLVIGFSSTWTLNYLWFVFYPISALIGGNIHHILQHNKEILEKCQDMSERVISIDELTGFGNSRELLRDLDKEMSRAKRYKHDLTLMVIQIQYFEELLAIYGDKDSSKIYQTLSDIIDKALRVEDMRFRLEDNLFALVLPHTPAENALIVKSRIKSGLDTLSIEDQSSLNRYRIEVKIGILQYDQNIPNPMAYKAATIKELEYDV